MNIEDRLKGYIIANYGSLKSFADAAGIPYPTVASIFKRGLKTATFANIEKMCRVLGISIDELSKGSLLSGNEFNSISANYWDITSVLRVYAYMHQMGSQFVLDNIALSDSEYELFMDQYSVIIEVMRKRRLKKDLKESNLK